MKERSKAGYGLESQRAPGKSAPAPTIADTDHRIPAQGLDLQEEPMSPQDRIMQLIRLHERAEHHANEYKRLSRIGGARSEMQKRLQKVAQLRSQISDHIRGLAWFDYD